VVGAGALGAVVGGLLVGTLPAPLDPRRGAVACSALFAAGYAPLALAPGVLAVTVISFVAGATFAPFGIAANRLVESSAPHERLTESLAWFSTTVVAGTAVGTAVGGRVVELWGAEAGYLLVAPVAFGPLVAVLAGVAAGRARESRGDQRPGG